MVFGPQVFPVLLELQLVSRLQRSRHLFPLQIIQYSRKSLLSCLGLSSSPTGACRNSPCKVLLIGIQGAIFPKKFWLPEFIRASYSLLIPYVFFLLGERFWSVCFLRKTFCQFNGFGEFFYVIMGLSYQ